MNQLISINIVRSAGIQYFLLKRFYLSMITFVIIVCWFEVVFIVFSKVAAE